jgi:hypothetical protein
MGATRVLGSEFFNVERIDVATFWATLGGAAIAAAATIAIYMLSRRTAKQAAQAQEFATFASQRQLSNSLLDVCVFRPCIGEHPHVQQV